MLKQCDQNQTCSHNQFRDTVKKFLGLFLPLTALVGTGLAIFSHIETNTIKSEIASTERREVEVKKELFINHISSIRADLIILSQQHELQLIFDPTSSQEILKKSRAALAQEYLVASQQKKQYNEIRLVDITGQEIVRVHFDLGKANIIPDAQLQNHSHRYWFKDTLVLKKGEVFISPLDLKINSGKIEQPLKPIIRFGTPVFDSQGRKRGMLVLSYLGEILLQKLSPQHSLSFGNLMLLNSQGYWLKGIKAEDEWGFMYDDRRDRTLKKAFPETWKQINTQQTGQFQNRQGLYTFTTIYPLLGIKGAKSSTGSGNPFGNSQARVDAKSYYWKLVTFVPTTVLKARVQKIYNQLQLLFVTLTGLIATGCWLLVQATIKRQQSEQQARGLKQTLEEMHRNQAQLVQTEKMASLGQLVAGIAHEINNPVNFIHGNLIHTNEYAHNLLKLIQLYQKHYPNPVPEIQAEIEATDLAFLQQDLPKLLTSMKVGADRIRQIVLSLRNFSRADEADCKEVDIHQGLESTLLILQHRLKPKSEHPAIEIVREYSCLPLVECYPGQLNQVFMNILANAIDALEEVSAQQTSAPTQTHPGQITLRTSVVDSDWVEIAIADNGPGMSKRIQEQIFNPFFTTKPIGKGTGMGMWISYQIVTEKHRGKLQCFSTPGKGTEFVIRLPIRQKATANYHGL